MLKASSVLPTKFLNFLFNGSAKKNCEYNFRQTYCLPETRPFFNKSENFKELQVR